MIHIVLFQPEIHLNTGNIIRTCLATNSQLHLIKPLGFKIDSATLKRYSSNNFAKLNPSIHKNWDDFLSSKEEGSMFFTSRKGSKLYSDFNLKNKDKNIYFIFGKESSGLPSEIIKNAKNLMRIPMSDKIKCLNLSNTVMTIIYEAKRQDNFHDLLIKDPFNS